MITFILIFAFIILAAAAWLIANGANQRSRARMAGKEHVMKQQEQGGGSAPVGRASGAN